MKCEIKALEHELATKPGFMVMCRWCHNIPCRHLVRKSLDLNTWTARQSAAQFANRQIHVARRAALQNPASAAPPPTLTPLCSRWLVRGQLLVQGRTAGVRVPRSICGTGTSLTGFPVGKCPTRHRHHSRLRVARWATLQDARRSTERTQKQLRCRPPRRRDVGHCPHRNLSSLEGRRVSRSYFLDPHGAKSPGSH